MKSRAASASGIGFEQFEYAKEVDSLKRQKALKTGGWPVLRPRWYDMIRLVGILLSALAVVMPSFVFGSQSVTLAWDPVTNADIAGYNVYYGSASQTYTNITSVGNVTNATISGLVEGATYYFALTSLSTSGLESAFSAEISYTVPNAVPIIQVTPGSIGYGTILNGTSATNSFVVQNVGTGTLSGTASVAGGPFSIVSGGNYNLGANASQTVTVAFSPTVASNYTQNVSLSGGGGASVTVSGIVTNTPSLVPPPPAIITKKITADITNLITLQLTTNLSSPNWQTIGVFTGTTSLSFTNLPAVFIRGICINLTASVKLTWQPSTDPTIAGYKIYYGVASHTYTSVVTVGNVTQATISNLIGGVVYYFQIDTYYSSGQVIPYSNEISAVAQVPSFSLIIGSP